MLPREVRSCFFQEGVFHFQLAVLPLELAQPGALGYLQWRLVLGMLLTVCPYPVTERGLAYPKLTGDVSDGP